MGTDRKPLPSDLHVIPNLQIPQVDLEREFDLLQEVGEGWYAKVFLVEHRKTRSEIVLKALHKDYVDKKEVIREFHYSYNLAVFNLAKVLVRTFDILFISNDCYVFAQEYAPFGDLTSNVSDIGIGEIYTKRVARQVATALDFLHDHHLVHRDVKLDNVLVFRSDFSRVKLSDFGECRKKGTLVKRFNEWVPYCPPEICNTAQEFSYSVEFSQDTWQFGVMIYLCLTGNIPWQKADKHSDPRFQLFDSWQRSRLLKPPTPKGFKIFSQKSRRLFRKIFELNPNKRAVALSDELGKYADDKWLTKLPEKPSDEDELSTNMSMLSFHSSMTDKNRLLFTLTRYGVETTVDRDLKKDRIKEWIASSTIEEEEPEDQEEDWELSSNDNKPGSSKNSNKSNNSASR